MLPHATRIDTICQALWIRFACRMHCCGRAAMSRAQHARWPSVTRDRIGPFAISVGILRPLSTVTRSRCCCGRVDAGTTKTQCYMSRRDVCKVTLPFARVILLSPKILCDCVGGRCVCVCVCVCNQLTIVGESGGLFRDFKEFWVNIYVTNHFP